MADAPRGIWFEENRNRWRVRLYINGKVFFRGYTRNYEDAYHKYLLAKEERERYKTPARDPIPPTLLNLANAIRANQATCIFNL